MYWTYAVEPVFFLFYVFDMVLQCNYFGYIEAGTIVNDTAKIRSRYFKKRFLVDLLATIPFEVIYIVLSPAGDITWLPWLSLSHLLRIVIMGEAVQRSNAKIQQIFNIPGNATQVMGVLLMITLVNHWCGSIWFILHRYFERNEPSTWATMDGLSDYNATTGEHNIINPEYSGFECYVRGVYFTITVLSTVGYGDIRPYTNLETIWQLMVILGGSCLFAVLIGTIQAFFTQRDSSGELAFRSKMHKMKAYMKYREIPRDLQVCVAMIHI